MHNPTQLNVAYDLRKGTQVKEMNERWLNGPDFVKLSRECCPIEARLSKHGWSKEGEEEIEDSLCN